VIGIPRQRALTSWQRPVLQNNLWKCQRTCNNPSQNARKLTFLQIDTISGGAVASLRSTWTEIFLPSKPCLGLRSGLLEIVDRISALAGRESLSDSPANLGLSRTDQDWVATTTNPFVAPTGAAAGAARAAQDGQTTCIATGGAAACFGSRSEQC
jgi:hypothetical protein